MGTKKSTSNTLTSKQKQAAIVCVICMLALIITICMTAVQVIKASSANGDNSTSASTSSSTDNSGYTGSDYEIDATTNNAVLIETEDMGEEYLNGTLFIGDSNTTRFYNNGMLDLQQVCSLDGITIEGSLTEYFVAFKNDSNLYSIAQAVAMMKPQRIVLTLGTNNADGSMRTDAFISSYGSLIDAIVDSYKYTDIIINAIPPVVEARTDYKDLSQEVIDSFNMALAKLAQDKGCKFLNSAETLKTTTGYADSDYYSSDGIHLKATGLNAILNYVTTHAYISEDRRPDTDNIPSRTNSSSTGSSSSSSSSSQIVSYTAKYFIDSAGGGTLTSGDDKEKSNLSFDIDSNEDSLTVTAVPNEGYVFVKWSDGVTSPTRIDKNFTQNVNVTAMFGTIGISIKLNTENPKAGSNVEFEASLTGGYGSINDIVWYVNGEKNAASAAGKSWLTIEDNTDYTIYAAITYNGTTIISAAITIEPEKYVEVPKIEGLSESAAKTALTDKGLVVGTITYVETSDSSQIGNVTFQATSSGTKVVEGSSINFTVGKEAAKLEVPNVVGQTAAAATASLQAAKFTGTIDTTSQTAYSDTIAEGCVISQNPTAGSKVTAGTSFVLTISLGKEPIATAVVPTIIGKTESEATTALTNAGFTGTISISYTDTESGVIGTVTACSVAEGSTIEKNTTITLTVEKDSET